MASNITITDKNKSKSDISYMPGALLDKVIDLTNDPVVQYDVPAVKNTSLHDDDNDHDGQ